MSASQGFLGLGSIVESPRDLLLACLLRKVNWRDHIAMSFGFPQTPCGLGLVLDRPGGFKHWQHPLAQ